MAPYKQENRPVRIETPLGQDTLLLKSFSGSERLGRPFQYDLVLASEGHDLDYKKIIGQNVTIYLEKEGKEPRYFNGFISRFAQTKYERRLAEYHATVVPWLWFLTRSSDCRIFQNLTIPAIIKQVFQDFGFSDIIDRLHGSYRTWSYCVQYRETAFTFVSRLMEEEGIYYYFKHEDGKHSIVLCDSPVSHKQFVGYEDLLYRPGAATVTDVLNTWVVHHEVESGTYAANNFDFTKPNANTTTSSFQDRNHGQSQGEQFDYFGEQSPFDQYSIGAANETERYSKLRLEELQAQHETYSAEGDARGVCNGVRFVLKGHPNKNFNDKEYLITGADYLIQCNPFETTDEHGQDFKYHAKMTAILLDNQFRTPRVTPKPIVHGPQTATVVGPAGQKIYTDPTGYGMVKVQFHWDRVGTNDENSSCWMRVSQAWAGKNWGDMAIPHVGDEVIVECLEGDADRPIITGRVYNAANMPPLDLPTNQDKRIWHDDFGNQLVFDATKGDEHISLYSPHHNSGIVLGRSIGTFTDSNTLNATMGTTLNVGLGLNMAATVGLAFTGVLGANVAAIVGSNYSLNLASQCGFNLGPQYSYTHGAAFAKNNGSDNKSVDGHFLISTKQNLNLVAGASADPVVGTAIFHAEHKSIEISVGHGVEPQDVTYNTGFKVVQGILAALPVGTAVLAGLSSIWSSKFNPNPADPNDWGATNIEQESLLGSAASLQVLGLIGLIASEALSKKAQTAAVLKQHGVYNAKLKLTQGTVGAADHTTGVAKLEATQLVELELGEVATPAKPKDAIIKMAADYITMVHCKGGIKIAVAPSVGAPAKAQIEINQAGEITITGQKVTIPGMADFGGGAFTVTAPPPPPPPPPVQPPPPLPPLPPVPVVSDENIKKNIEVVDYVAVLDKLATVPVRKWHYHWEQDSDTPNIGPMAQAFKAAFYPGRDDKSITMLEFDGVQLAAIQGLNQKLINELKRRDAENAELQTRLEKLERIIGSKIRDAS